MPAQAVITLAMAATACLVLSRAYGVTYVGRTRGGLTCVRTDTRAVGERIRVLDVCGTLQSATYLDERWCDPVFAYHRLYDHLFDAWEEGTGPASVAILGGGGYAYPKHLVAHHPEVSRIDVVEIDPAIERIARRHFFLDRLESQYHAEASGRFALHTADALDWLRSSDRHFDAIVNDCFCALEPEPTLLTAEAAQVFHEHLCCGGVYLSNVVAALEGPDAQVLYEVLDALGTAFAHLWVYPCGASDPTKADNNVVIATDAPCAFPSAWQWDQLL